MKFQLFHREIPYGKEIHYPQNKELLRKGYALKPKFPGIFIAGDIADHTYKQAVTAAAFGCQAAMDAEKWLEDNSK